VFVPSFQFNTSTGYLAARAAAATQGLANGKADGVVNASTAAPGNAMAALEASKPGMAFVP
jgi:hypothetical protein